MHFWFEYSTIDTLVLGTYVYVYGFKGYVITDWSLMKFGGTESETSILTNAPVIGFFDSVTTI